MAGVCNLDTCLGGYSSLFFIMVEVSNLIGKIADLMVIIIRVVGLMAVCFGFL